MVEPLYCKGKVNGKVVPVLN